ncbi:TPA: hypothetical protein I8Y96_000402 [Legionella pneumophila]|nr:hypothetical protein [Legionella pneumophila]
MISFQDGVKLIEKDSTSIQSRESELLGKGFTKKLLMVNQEQETFLAKSPDPLSVQEVFRGYIPEKKLDSTTEAVQKHLFSLELELSFIEVLIPCFMRVLFADQLITPEVYLHIDKNNHIFVLSKLLNGFDEFLYSKVAGKFGYILDHKKIPSRKDLDLTEQEAYLVGQLYAAALIFNHWDILNSRLLNAGKIEISGQTKACIVDFGFCLHLSYKGRHTDSLCLDDENFSYGKRINYRFFSLDYNRDYRHRFALPFDTMVGTLLPHTLIEDLYQLSGNDRLSTAMRNGFAAMIKQADKSIRSNPKLYEEVFSECLQRISNESSVKAEDLPYFLNMNYYLGKIGDDNLFSIIKGRIRDCFRLLSCFEQGIDPRILHENARDTYYKVNSF